MKTFSRLSLFTLVCLGFALVLLGNTADVHAQDPSLTVSGDTGEDTVYEVGESVSTEFFAQIGASPASGAKLTIMTNGIGNPSITGDATTDLFGKVTITGTILVKTGAYIEATWGIRQLKARADFNAEVVGIDPALIVVKSPDPKSSLKIGDSFTQTIVIENRVGNKVEPYSTLPLSAWQMDVVYNPSILKVVDVTEGDFLTEGGAASTHYTEMLSSGKISVSQARAGLTPPPPPATAQAPSPEGIALAPGDDRNVADD